MLDTAYDMYMTFLDGIRKQHTGTVTPDVFTRLVNEWGQYEWLETNISAREGIELTQKQIEDLQIIKIATDGIDKYNAVTLLPIPVHAVPENYFFDIPNGIAINGIVYPKMYRLLNVEFKINYRNNPCYKGVSGWLTANVMRSDQKMANKYNPYRKPTDERLYYEMKNNVIVLITGTSSDGNTMKLEYLRYPRQIIYQQGPPVVDIPCEFADTQRKEIIDLTVRHYLERASDPRYQSFLQEESIRAINKK